MSGRFTHDRRPAWQQLAGMSNTEWADFHAKFIALPLTEKFRGLSQIHDSFSNMRFERDDRRFSEQEHTQYTNLCRTLHSWTLIKQKPTHETDQQTALASAIAGDETLQNAAKNWKTLDETAKLAAMDRVQQLHAKTYGIEPAQNIAVAPRYMNAGLGLDAYYDHDDLSDARSTNKIFNDTLDHFGDAVSATLQGASSRVVEQQRRDWFGGSDDINDPAALQGSMFHLDFFSSSDMWGHQDGEFQRYTERPMVSYARETAVAVLDQLQGRIDDAAPTISDTKREAIYRIGKIEEHITDGRVHDRDRAIMRRIEAISDMPDEQIGILGTGLKAHILAAIQHDAASFDGNEHQTTQKAAFELGNRITRLTKLEPEFIAHQQKLEEHLVNRMRNDPVINKARKNWPKMSNDDRLSVLDRAATMHAEVYGYHKPAIELYEAPRDPDTRILNNGLHYKAYGGYPNGRVRINTDKESSFHDFQNSLNTVLHESTHAFQHQLGDKFATRDAKNLNPAEQKQAQQFFWTTKSAFYGDSKRVGYENYRAQNVEEHAFSQGNALAARVAAPPQLRERIDRIARKVQNFADGIGQKVSLVHPKRKTAQNAAASA